MGVAHPHNKEPAELSHAVELIEQRCQQNRQLKVVSVPCGLHEDRNAARDSHFAAHPEDRGANIVIFNLYDEKMAREGQACTASAGPACEEP
jgi:hypothetical protein